MRKVLFVAVFAVLSARVDAEPLYVQPPSPAGGVCKSSWRPPDGLDGDAYVYDAFLLPAGGTIKEIQWRGGYTNYLQGAGKSPVSDFTISIYPSIPSGIQPDILAKPWQWNVGGNAGEASAGTFGGIDMYDYRFTLPIPFVAEPHTKYWLQVEASQDLTPIYNWPPDWGLAVAASGDGSYFREITGGTYAGGKLYQTIGGDVAFALVPQPGTLVLLATGFLTLALLYRRVSPRVTPSFSGDHRTQ